MTSLATGGRSLIVKACTPIVEQCSLGGIVSKVLQGSLNFEEWHVAAQQAFGTLHITTPEDKSDFEVGLEAIHVGDIDLFDMRTPAHRVERRAADIPAAEKGYCKLSLQLEGSSILEQDGRRCVLEPSNLAVYFTQRPYVLEYPAPQRTLVMIFPQSFVNLPDSDLEKISAVPISRESGLGRVAVPLFEQLAGNLRALEDIYAIPLVRSALDMLVSVIASDLLADTDNTESLNHQVRRFVAAHLADPELGPRMIADSLFVSVRHLHSQFSRGGETVGSYIRRVRLDKIRDSLADPRFASDTIQAIGSRYGLVDAAHLSKSFTARFGISPSAYRRSVLGKGE